MDIFDEIGQEDTTKTGDVFDQVSSDQSEDIFDQVSQPKTLSSIDIHRKQEYSDIFDQVSIDQPGDIFDQVTEEPSLIEKAGKIYKEGMEFAGKYTPARIPMFYADVGKQVAGMALAIPAGWSHIIGTIATGDMNKAKKITESWMQYITPESYTPEGKAIQKGIEKGSELIEKAGTLISEAYQDLSKSELEYDPGRQLKDLGPLPPEFEKYYGRAAREAIATYEKRGNVIAEPSKLGPYVATYLGTLTVLAGYSAAGKTIGIVGKALPKGVTPEILKKAEKSVKDYKASVPEEVFNKIQEQAKATIEGVPRETMPQSIDVDTILKSPKASEILLDMRKGMRGSTHFEIELAQKALISSSEDVLIGISKEAQKKWVPDPNLLENTPFTETIEFVNGYKYLEGTLDSLPEGAKSWPEIMAKKWESQIYALSDKLAGKSDIDFIKLTSEVDGWYNKFKQEASNEVGKFQKTFPERASEGSGPIETLTSDLQRSGQETILEKPGPITPTPVLSPKTTPLGLSKNVEQRAIESGIKDTFGELPEGATMNMADQAQKVSDLMDTAYEQAKRIAMGEIEAPQGIYPENVYTGIRIKAMNVGDVDTLRMLATTSKLNDSARIMGQRIKSLDAGYKGDPVHAMKEISDIRKIIAQKRLGKRPIDKVKLEISNEIKTSIRRINPNKQTWSTFIQSLEC